MVSHAQVRGGDAGHGQVYGDATILFPLLVAETFAQEHAAARPTA